MFLFNFLNLVILVSSQCSLDFTGTMRFMKSSNFFHPVEQDRNETEIWVGVILKTLKELMWKETKRHHVSATKNQTKQKKTIKQNAGHINWKSFMILHVVLSSSHWRLKLSSYVEITCVSFAFILIESDWWRKPAA